MDDLISRQAAIEALENERGLYIEWRECEIEKGLRLAIEVLDNIPSAQEELNLWTAADILLKFLDTDQGCFSFQMKTKDGVVLPMDVGYVWDGLKAIKQYAAGDFKAETWLDGFRAVPPCPEGAET